MSTNFVQLFQPEVAHKRMQTAVADAIKTNLSVTGMHRSVEVKGVEFGPQKDIMDFKAQAHMRDTKGTLSQTVKAHVVLKDNTTGKVLSQSKVNVGHLPVLTPRLSYLVNGREYQVQNQFRLRSGVYTRIADNGAFEAAINNNRKGMLKMTLDPASRMITIKPIKGSDMSLNVYALLRGAGRTDEQIAKQWGQDVVLANKAKYKDEVKLRTELSRIAMKVAEPGETFTNSYQAAAIIFKHLRQFTLDPRVTQDVLGKPHTMLSPEALEDSSVELLKVVRGEKKPTSYDNLGYKDLMGPEDLVVDFMNRNATMTRRRLLNKVDREADVTKVVQQNMLDRNLVGFFKNGGETQLSSEGNQTNPVAMINGHMVTTVLGAGGVSKGPGMKPGAANKPHSSQINILDPVDTGEKAEAGMILTMALNSGKRGNDVTTHVYSVKEKKMVELDALTADRANIAFPDDYDIDFKTLTFKPTKPLIRIISGDGKFKSVPVKEVEYIIPNGHAQFGPATNLVPFLGNNNGNRVMMAAKMSTQALSLKHREVPLVQIETPGGNSTMEKAVGSSQAALSPVDGVVQSVGADDIKVRGNDGKVHKVSLYDHFPTNDKRGVLQHEPLVKAGDKVRKGQVLADLNFTRDGTLALGTNLRVGYMSLKEYNFEDGVVISRSAAEKLTSIHMHKYDLQSSIPLSKQLSPAQMNQLDDGAVVISKKAYLAWAPASARLSASSVEKLEDNGVIRKGSVVEKGDVLIAAVRKSKVDNALSAIKSTTRFNAPFRPYEVKWENNFKGKVSRISIAGDTVVVYVDTEEPMTVGDKLVGRYGNKGIVTQIREDHEMPFFVDKKTGEKKHLEVALHPAGVPGRINPGQLLEVAASKIAEHDGKTFVAKPFTKDDVTRTMLQELKKRGLSDQEDMIDPETGKGIGSVLAGKMYIQKLVHLVDKKLTGRAAGALPGVESYSYDLNKQPNQGYPTGGQALGALGLYALLGHNARGMIRDLQAHHSSYERAEKPGEYDSDDYWLAMMNGFPPPKAADTYAVRKFEAHLKAMGLDTRKGKDEYHLVPMTDKEVLKQCTFEVKAPNRALDGKSGKPDQGGLFDFPDGDITSNRWGHVKLGGPVLNPTFEMPAKILLGLKDAELQEVIEGKRELDGKTGMDAINTQLAKIDPVKRAAELKEEVKTLKGDVRDKAYKQIKVLNNLNKYELTPREAYMMSVMPVLPPSMRPVGLSSMSGAVGDIETVDINQLYRQVGQAAYQLRTLPKESTSKQRAEVNSNLYDALKAAYVDGAINNRGAPMSSLLQSFTTPKGPSGEKQGKEGFFQKKLIKRRYDLTGRSVIVPEPALSLDQVGLPRKMAMQIYRPFIIRELKAAGYSPREAIEKLRDPKNEVVMTALENAMRDRPALIKRDPALHKHNILAFDPVITEGKSIQIHPLTVGGFNADFDGDTMAVYVPSGEEARKEALRMKPSANLFSPKSHGLMNGLAWGSVYGVYQLSEIDSQSGKSFATQAEALLASKEGKIADNVGFKLGKGITSIGRLKLYNVFPDEVKRSKYGDLVLYGDVLTSKKCNGMLADIAREFTPHFPKIADGWKNLGNQNSYEQVWSYGLSDHLAHSDIRDKHLKAADAKLAKMNNPSDEVRVKTYELAAEKIRAEVKERMSTSGNRLWRMTGKSGALGSKYNQVEQMVISPLQVTDLDGDVVPDPVRESYSEGMASATYWTAIPGVRAGTLSRAAGTSDPGARAKDLINLAINLVVTDKDCGTRVGVPINPASVDAEGRFLSEAVQAGSKTFNYNTLTAPDVLAAIKTAGIKSIKVRSPLTCSLTEGVCSHCVGLNENGKLVDIGENQGVNSAQACSEPLTQMSMNAFHTGGSASGAGGAASPQRQLRTVSELLEMPHTLKDRAILSPRQGRVKSIEKDAGIGGFNVTIDDTTLHVPASRKVIVMVGQTVQPAERISDGSVSPRDVLEYAGIGAARAHLVNELHSVYGLHGVRRKHVETLVRNLTNTVEVTDDPEAEFAPGDTLTRTKSLRINEERKASGAAAMSVKPILKDISEAVKIGTEGDYLAGLNYQGLKNVIKEGAAYGTSSQLHGVNPIPGLVYAHEFGKGLKPGTY